MKIIVGLGNPTREYAGTRHNVGFSVIYNISDAYNISVETKKHKALIGKGVIEGEKVVLAMPQTYMNLSGESVRELMDFYKCDLSDLIVIYDDISLDVGKLRINNINAHLGTQEYTRSKIGVGEKPAKMDLADYVLGHFSKEEQPVIRESADRAREAVCEIITHGAASAMNKYN